MSRLRERNHHDRSSSFASWTNASGLNPSRSTAMPQAYGRASRGASPAGPGSASPTARSWPSGDFYRSPEALIMADYTEPVNVLKLMERERTEATASAEYRPSDSQRPPTTSTTTSRRPATHGAASEHRRRGTCNRSY